MQHPLQSMIKMRKQNKQLGAYSACSAHPYVIESVVKRAKETGTLAVIEATANQVNQFGGYTGMLPADFKMLVESMAEKYGLPHKQLVLGGDHLGPIVWSNEDSRSAMAKAEDLIASYVMAGFTKIHIDTSMKLGDDSAQEPLNPELIAQRGARLCSAAEKAFAAYRETHPDAVHPVYVIGSEVPIPGGIQQNEGIHVTSSEDFINTVRSFKNAFDSNGLDHAWKDVIAVVVQPGVEFGNNIIYNYDSLKAHSLTAALSEYPDMIFEGHSTDYQTKENLKQMVLDGIAILKVGPALTFALREAFLALENMEKVLFAGSSSVSDFSLITGGVMLEDPKYWISHYNGTPSELLLSLKYSFSDRIRYYWCNEKIVNSIKILKRNIDSADLPLSLISQFLPGQYIKIRENQLEPKFDELVIDKISDCINDYIYAVTE